MSRTTKKQASQNVRPNNARIFKPVNEVKESTIIYFGTEKNPEVQASIAMQARIGRKTETVVRPSFDTGIGMCGSHLCNCKTICKKELAPAVAFQGDAGPSMGASY